MRVLSLFSGIGAHDLGLERAGMVIAGQVEIDDYCLAVLEQHFPHAERWNDVRTVTADDVVRRCGRIDLLTGGVPCQPASVAGKRLGAADARWLWPEYLRLVVALRPRWLLAENVPGFLSLPESERVFADLEEAGYEVQPYVAGAWTVGAPHKRDRVWIVGRRVDLADVPGCGIAGEGDARRGESRGGAGTDAAIGGAGQPVADANITRLEVGRISPSRSEPAQPVSTERGVLRWPVRPGEPQHEWEAPRLTVGHATRSGDGGARGRDGHPRMGSASPDEGGRPEGPTQPGLGGATPGFTRRMDSFARRSRLKALGNANPPWVPEIIGRWMMAQEVH